jgi:hypothetical protein
MSEKGHDYNYYCLRFCENYYKPTRFYIRLRDVVFDFEKLQATLPIKISQEYLDNVSCIGNTLGGKENVYGVAERNENIATTYSLPEKVD